MSEPFAAIEQALTDLGDLADCELCDGEVVKSARAELEAARELLKTLRFAQEVIARYTHGVAVPAGMILSVSQAMEAAIAACQPGGQK